MRFLVVWACLQQQWSLRVIIIPDSQEGVLKSKTVYVNPPDPQCISKDKLLADTCLESIQKKYQSTSITRPWITFPVVWRKKHTKLILDDWFPLVHCIAPADSAEITVSSQVPPIPFDDLFRMMSENQADQTCYWIGISQRYTSYLTIRAM